MHKPNPKPEPKPEGMKPEEGDIGHLDPFEGADPHDPAPSVGHIGH